MLLNKLRQWMAGRYGTDQLNLCLLASYLLLSVLSLPFRRYAAVGLVLMLLSYALVILVFFRMFSRNTAKRYQENQKFLNFWNPLWGRLKGKGRRMKDHKEYHFYNCPGCGQKIRIPRGKGKICITCPKCRTEFVKKS